MPGQMSVRPETMSAAGSDLDRLGSQMASGLRGLQSTIEGSGSPWGGDKQGTLFGALYDKVLGSAFSGIASHVAQVSYAGQALGRQATTYSEVETHLTQQYTQAAGQLGG